VDTHLVDCAESPGAFADRRARHRHGLVDHEAALFAESSERVRDCVEPEQWRKVVSSGRRNEIVVGGRIVYSSNPQGTGRHPKSLARRGRCQPIRDTFWCELGFRCCLLFWLVDPDRGVDRWRFWWLAHEAFRLLLVGRVKGGTSLLADLLGGFVVDAGRGMPINPGVKPDL